MHSLRHLHDIMHQRRKVLLQDGRIGAIIRIDTHYPDNDTTISVWTQTPTGPGVAKVGLGSVVGPAPEINVKANRKRQAS